MIDIAGREIVTGDIVIVGGAYCQCHNGYWVVTRSPGDENWIGEDHSLTKLSRYGKVSYTKHNLSSWPLMHFVANQKVADEARVHDEKYAYICVIGHTDMQPDDFEKSNPEHVERIDFGKALF